MKSQFGHWNELHENIIAYQVNLQVGFWVTAHNDELFSNPSYEKIRDKWSTEYYPELGPNFRHPYKHYCLQFTEVL